MPSIRSIVALSVALVLAGIAGAMWFSAPEKPAVAVADVQPAEPAAIEEEAIEELVVAKPELTREEKRFARADRNDDGRIQRSEYLHARKRNFDRLDVNGDGRLSFEEYAKSGIDKFVSADSDKDNVLNAKEFATLAPKPRAPRPKAKAECDCSEN